MRENLFIATDTRHPIISMLERKILNDSLPKDFHEWVNFCNIEK